MTIRDYLNQHIWRATICCWIAIPFSLVSVFGSAHRNIRLLALLTLGILFAIAYYQTFSARCLRCKTCVLFAAGSFGVRLAIPSWFRSCPSCGLSFDTPHDEHNPSNHAWMQRTPPHSDA